MRLSFFRPLDVAVFTVFCAVAVCSVLAVRTRRTGTPLLVVNTPGGEFVYPLGKNRELTVAGALGDSVLVIQDGRAFFKDSPCPNKVCVQSVALQHDGDWSACLPNQVILHVENKAEQAAVDVTVK